MDPIVNTRSARWSNYVIAFLITALIFGTALFASELFNSRRIADIQNTQQSISIDILSLETQFDLLAEHSCSDISENSVLSKEIYPVGQRLAYLEAQSNVNQSQLEELKRYYSLLEIKDYLLMQQVAQKCHLKPVFILYFYSNKGDCTDCEEQGYVLTGLSSEYPTLRVYSFDYNLDLSALRTLVDIHDVRDTLPALVINGKVYYGLHTMADIEKVLPQLATLPKNVASTTTSAQ